jgi:hypothetical protein
MVVRGGATPPTPPPPAQHCARICKRLRRPGIDSEESVPPSYEAWQAGPTKRVIVPARQAGNRFLGSLKGLQIRVQASGQIFKDDVNGFSSISDICFLPRETNELAHEIQRGSKRGRGQIVFQHSILEVASYYY